MTGTRPVLVGQEIPRGPERSRITPPHRSPQPGVGALWRPHGSRATEGVAAAAHLRPNSDNSAHVTCASGPGSARPASPEVGTVQAALPGTDQINISTPVRPRPPLRPIRQGRRPAFHHQSARQTPLLSPRARPPGNVQTPSFWPPVTLFAAHSWLTAHSRRLVTWVEGYDSTACAALGIGACRSGVFRGVAAREASTE
jgi:hypothetical protein